MRKHFPLVSVIVPVFKVEKYLHRCIESIRKQTYPYLEIILVDDGSPDNCGDICEKSAAFDERIVVIHKKNGGLSSARNAGLDIATGEYVAFIDSDDMISLRFVETLVGLCEKHGCDIAQCDFLAVDENFIEPPFNLEQIIRFYDNKQALHEQCCGRNSVSYSVVWNKVYKKYLFDEIRYPVGRIHEDEFTTYKVLWKLKKMAVTNQYMYYYLQRSSSIMGRPFSLGRLDVLEALGERSAFLKERNMEEEYHATLRTILFWIEKNYKILTERMEKNETIRRRLLDRKEKIADLLPKERDCVDDKVLIYRQMEKSCIYPPDSTIVLYGAGKWGRLFFQHIKKSGKGKIVGWVDNRWYEMKQTDYPVRPLDMLLQIDFDYVLIAIESEEIQNEVRENLVCWGISASRILSISV